MKGCAIMNPNTTQDKLIELLKKQITIRDETINTLTRENKVQSIIIKNQKKIHNKLTYFLIFLLILSAISNMLCLLN